MRRFCFVTELFGRRFFAYGKVGEGSEVTGADEAVVGMILWEVRVDVGVLLRLPSAHLDGWRLRLVEIDQ